MWRTFVYLFIITAFLARAGLYFYYYRNRHHRKDDLFSGMTLVLLALSFSAYAISRYTQIFSVIEIVIDILLGVLSVAVVIHGYLRLLKEHHR